MKYNLGLYSIVFFLALNTSFAQLVHDFKVNDDTALSIPKYYARISTNKNGLSCIAWYPSGIIKNIYAQIYNNNFHRINNNFAINSQPDSILDPDIIISNNNNLGFVWSKYGYAYNQIIFRIFNKDCIPLTSEIQLIDTLNSYVSNPKIGCDSSGRFIIAWQRASGNRNIYFQILDSSGNKIGNNIKVSDGNDDFGPDILVKKDGSFIIVWRSHINIFIKMFDKNGNALGTSQKVNDTITAYDWCNDSKIVQDSVGNFIVAFNEYITNSNWNYVKYQRYDKDGIKIGSNKEIPGFPGELYLSSFDSDESGNLIFQLNFPNAIYYHIFNIRIDRYDNPIGTYFPASNEFIESGKTAEDIKLYNKKIINVWRDIRLSTQPQIYANVRSFNNPDSTVGIINFTNEIQNQYKLYQNYPNPFNPTTKIRFDVPNGFPIKVLGNDRFVILKVYDITGREIQTLVDEQLKPGSYEVTFDGLNLSSGIYFYSFYVNNKLLKTNKMLLLK